MRGAERRAKRGSLGCVGGLFPALTRHRHILYRIAFDKSEKNRLSKEHSDALKAARQKAEDDSEADRLAGLKLTQDTMSMMRKYGTVAASNPPDPIEEDPQRPTDEKVRRSPAWSEATR